MVPLTGVGRDCKCRNYKLATQKQEKLASIDSHSDSLFKKPKPHRMRQRNSAGSRRLALPSLILPLTIGRGTQSQNRPEMEDFDGFLARPKKGRPGSQTADERHLPMPFPKSRLGYLCRRGKAKESRGQHAAVLY